MLGGEKMERKSKLSLIAIVAITLLVGTVAAAVIGATAESTSTHSAPHMDSYMYDIDVNVVQGEWAYVNSRTINPHEASYTIVISYVLTHTNLGNWDDVTLEWYDGSSWQGMTVPSGYFGGSAGFEVGIGYDVTSQIRVGYFGTPVNDVIDITGTVTVTITDILSPT